MQPHSTTHSAYEGKIRTIVVPADTDPSTSTGTGNGDYGALHIRRVSIRLPDCLVRKEDKTMILSPIGVRSKMQRTSTASLDYHGRRSSAKLSLGSQQTQRHDLSISSASPFLADLAI